VDDEPELAEASVLPALSAALAHTPLPAEKVITGSPIEGNRTLASSGETTVGLWELTASVSRDVEADEVFVVLAGRATVEIAARDVHAAATLELEAGSIVRLSAGMRTVWHVHETLRKFYVAL
jgi:uncharacterized protein